MNMSTFRLRAIAKVVPNQPLPFLISPFLLAILLFCSLSVLPRNSNIDRHHLTTTLIHRSLHNSTSTDSSSDWAMNQRIANKRDRKIQMTKAELDRARIAICLVGGARRFELTGPSIVDRVLEVYRNADLFVNTPLDKEACKLSLLKSAPKVATVRIFEPQMLAETEASLRVLNAVSSPSGIQGLLQYFNMVEGCLRMIESHQKANNFTYDWIVRTRVDGFWNGPLSPSNFVPGQYTVPSGSAFGGLNDRLGIGDFKSSTVALSRLHLLPKLYAAGLRRLNSEAAFRAQLTTQHVPFAVKQFPFCIVSDRRYSFSPTRFSVPVAALSSSGPLSGAKCRPCTPACEGGCVGRVMSLLSRSWSWTEWRNGSLQLCDPRGGWEEGWERIFEATVGEKSASDRRRVDALTFEECVSDFEEMKRKSSKWDAPPAEEICGLGLPVMTHLLWGAVSTTPTKIKYY